jgi:hypothetical protein
VQYAWASGHVEHVAVGKCGIRLHGRRLAAPATGHVAEEAPQRRAPEVREELDGRRVAGLRLLPDALVAARDVVAVRGEQLQLVFEEFKKLADKDKEGLT